MTVASALGNAPIRSVSRSVAASSATCAAGLREPVGDRVGVGEQQRARLGRRRPARAALEQPHAELALERRDLLRDRRLGERERLAGPRERALPDDLTERQQPPRIHIDSAYSTRELISPAE